MKARWPIVLLTFLFVSLSFYLPIVSQKPAVHASEGAGDLILALNDERIAFPDVQPEIHADVSFVPIVRFAEAAGFGITADEQQVMLTKEEGNSLVLYINENKASDNVSEPFDIWLYTRDGQLMAPFHFVASYFGYEVSYFAEMPLIRAKNEAAVLTDEELLAQELARLAKEREEKRPPIYLTFDDGPTSETSELLDCLNAYGAKATFFMLGPNMTKYSSVTKRLLEEGHQPALHGMTHEVKKFYLSPQSALEEMNQANQRLLKATGVETTLIRTPYGSKPYYTESYRDATAKAGYHLWDWNIDSNDWKYKSRPEAIYDGVIADVQQLKSKGTTPIILFHDQAATIKVLPKILDKLAKEGYRFDTINEEMTPQNYWHDER